MRSPCRRGGRPDACISCSSTSSSSAPTIPAVPDISSFARPWLLAGHRVTILAGRRSYLTGAVVSHRKRESLAPGVEIIRCGRRAGASAASSGGHSASCPSRRPPWWTGANPHGVDLVWGTSPPLLQVASAWAIARLHRAPFVFEVRDLWPAFAVATGVLRSRILIRLSLGLDGFLYRRVDHLIVNSPGFVPHLTAARGRRSSGHAGRQWRRSAHVRSRLQRRAPSASPRTGWTVHRPLRRGARSG